LSISTPIEAGHCCQGLRTIFEIKVPITSIKTSKMTSLAVKSGGGTVLGLNVIYELRKAPKDDEDRPELGDDLPGMNRRVEVLPKEDDTHPNQRERPEN
jgi:hypothetical protein